jgi:indolepyruvate ferredoxin oxidoreductase
MITSTQVQFPEPEGLLAAVRRVTRKDEGVFLDAVGMAEALFDDHMTANLLLLGAAYQAGAIPVSAAAIEAAIALNGVSVQTNTQAFRAGRLAVVDPAWALTIKKARVGALAAVPALTGEARALLEAVGAEGELHRLLEVRVPELVAYQDLAYARQYVDFVKRVRQAERAAAPGESRLSEGVAIGLFTLMAYKDEYEVARLHLKADLAGQLAGWCPAGVRVYYHLSPPILRALGIRRKFRLGKWFEAAFRLLVRVRRIRGSALDPFGSTEVRRAERALIGEYRTLIEEALADLSPEGYERAVKLAGLPDLVRGYEEIKLRNIQRFREEVRALGFPLPPTP